MAEAPALPRPARRTRPKPAAASDPGAGTAGEARRARVLDAARRVFESKGLEGAHMRAIAAEAGYTVGALYFYYKSKEEIYADLLSASLRRLREATAAGGADAHTPGAKAAARALAFYDYYVARPDEITLGLYLFQGIRPRGLTRDLNRQLNAQLWDALAEIQIALTEGGVPLEDARRETTALFAHCVGTLVLVHTGRIRMFGQDGRDLFARYVRGLTNAPSQGPP